MRSFVRKIVELFFLEKERWFSFVPVMFGVGVGVYFLLSFEPSIWVSLVLFELLLLAAFLCRFSNVKLGVVLFLGIVLLGFMDVQLQAYQLAKNSGSYGEEKRYISGQVEDVDYNYRGMPRLTLRDVKDFDGNEIKGLVRVGLMGKSFPHVGSKVEMIASFYPPLQPVMVGGYQFNRKYFFEGIMVTGSAKSRTLVIEEGEKQGFWSLVARVRMGIIERVHQVLDKDEASMAAAIIAGEQGKISHKLYDDYRDSGLAHFISISGLHMSMVAGLMFFMVRFIIACIPSLVARIDSKKVAGVFAIILSFVYLLISGMDVPAQRAFIMTLIVLIGVLFSRIAISMKTISWAALIILIISPAALIGASFQMSFAAVVCLIAFYERYATSLRNFLNRGGIFRILVLYVGGILAADTVASLATLPFAMYHFNRIAVYTTLGNLIAGPVIGIIIMPFLVLSLVFMPFGLDYYPLKIMGYGIGLVNDITHFVAELPGAGYKIVSMPMWGLLLIVFGGLWLCIWQQSWRKWGWIGIVFGISSVFVVSNPDIIINEDVFAVKDNLGNMVVMPVRGVAFEKKLWLEKSASEPLTVAQQKKLKKIYQGKETDKVWLDLSCEDDYCIYKGIYLDKNNLGEARSVWLPDKVITVKEYVGERYWR